jgi:hypothetical protein
VVEQYLALIRQYEPELVLHSEERESEQAHPAAGSPLIPEAK